MNVERITLCYPNGDKIVVNSQESLERFVLDKIQSMEIVSTMTLDEFNRIYRPEARKK